MQLLDFDYNKIIAYCNSLEKILDKLLYLNEVKTIYELLPENMKKALEYQHQNNSFLLDIERQIQILVNILD